MAEAEPLESYFKKSTEKNEFEEIDLKFELLRLQTFVNWPDSCPVYPIRLASAGFYYTGDNDTVICFICKKTKNGWKNGEDPFEVHKRLNPECPYVINRDQENFSPVLPANWQLPDRFDKIKDLFSPSQSNANETSLAEGMAGSTVQQETEPVSVKSGSSDSGSFSDRIQAERSIQPVRVENKADNNVSTNQISTSVVGGDQLGPSLSSLSSSGSDSYTMVKQSLSSGTSSQTRPASGRSTPVQSQRENRHQNQAASRSDVSSRGRFDNLGTLGTGNNYHNEGPLKVERNRLESFRNWPANANVNPQDLAKSGFFYTGQGDRVQCVFCRGILRNWDQGDIPHIEHRNKYARCPFMLGMSVGNVPMSANQSPHQPSTVNRGSHYLNQGPASMASLGISTERPKHPNYAIEGNRIATFNNSNWPSNIKHQTPKQLAQAGFFYAGFGDNVKCFFCDGGLKNWEPGDDPWEEHTRWYPRCPFVKSVKGEQYIHTVQNKYNSPAQSLASNVNEAQPRGHDIEEREIKARLETPLVITVLNTGVSRQAVMVAIERRLRETGNDFPNAQELMNKVLELEESGDLTTSGPQQNETASSNQNVQVAVSSSSTGTQNSNSASEMGSGAGQGNAGELVTEPVNMAGPSGGAGPSSGQPSGESGGLEKENRILKEQKTCKICLDNEVGVVFLPCGHLCCCVTCAPAVSVCPICRTDIKGSVRTYIP